MGRMRGRVVGSWDGGGGVISTVHSINSLQISIDDPFKGLSHSFQCKTSSGDSFLEGLSQPCFNVKRGLSHPSLNVKIGLSHQSFNVK